MFNLKKIKTLIFGLIILGATSFFAPACLAASETSDIHLVDYQSDAYKTGNYTLSDVRGYAIYLMKIILSIVGVLSLLAFIYGGMIVLLSAGNTSQVKKGMDAIKAAIIGLIITFSSILIINISIKTIGASWNVQTGAVSTGK